MIGQKAIIFRLCLTHERIFKCLKNAEKKWDETKLTEHSVNASEFDIKIHDHNRHKSMFDIPGVLQNPLFFLVPTYTKLHQVL